MERPFLNELKERDQINQIYLVREKTLSLGKNGRPYLSLVLGDSTGTMDAKMWDRVEESAQEVEAGELALVRGVVQVFQSRKQIIIQKIEKAAGEGLDPTQFMPTSRVDSESLFVELMTLLRTMKNPQLQQLVKDTLEDPEIKVLLLKAPAAKSIHHAWTGGLIEHIVSITKILLFFADHYPNLNRDLLIFGALYHDLGKIWELSWEKGTAYTSRGRLLGHMELACELIDRKTQRILGFSSELRDLCKHMVLSHHGKIEYGSPKLPQFREAMLVAMIDDLDSKFSAMDQWIESERVSGGSWSRFNENFERYFLLDDLKAKFS